MQVGPFFADLIGSSASIGALRAKLARLVTASRGRPPAVLLQGETGTGKGLLARALHAASARALGPFVDLNCAAVPPTLLETEMFGHAEGAFSDARRARPGLVQAAHNGTLFLDEVAALSPELQAKLLKAIEEQVVRRVGATQTEAVDIWVISAANKDLAAAVAAGSFRADLYHRLAGVAVTIPPLRERGDDVLVLAEHFLDRAARIHGGSRLTLAPDARQALLAHDWPGNVRELANLVERLALLETGPLVTSGMLGLSTPPSPAPVQRSSQTASGHEQAQITAALEATGWNVSQAADRLGLSRNTLRYRMSRLGLVGVSAPQRRPKGFRWDGPGRPELQRRVTLLALKLRSVTEHPCPVMRTIARFGGRVEEATSNHVLAVFGFRADEHAPRHAAEAALTLVTTRDAGCNAAVVDIATLAPAARGGLRREERARAVSALRPLLEGADAGVVLLSTAAAAVLAHHFRLEPVPGPAGQETLRLVAPLNVPFAERRGIATPFVGRDDDLAFLDAAVAETLSGRGQFIGVMGEPGVGKSRLLNELGGRAAGRGMQWIALTCVSHARGVPYQPVTGLLRHRWGLDVTSPPALVAATARRRVREAHLDVELSTGCVLRLLGVIGEGDLLAGLAPEAIGRATADTLRRLLMAGEGALVVAVEDLHWADGSTQDLLGTLVGMAARAPILIVATYRPGYRPPWINRSIATQIALAPLTLQTSRRLVRAILDDGAAPEAEVDRLVARGQGNPLFLEELTWELRQGPPSEAGRLPDSLEDAIAARLGRLSPIVRRLLSVAAVLGPEAPVNLLHEVVGESELRRLLDELTRLELLRASGAAPVYSFRHVLIQEVCYARLPEDERRRLHAAAAGALQRLWAGREDEVLDHLARHHAGAGQPTPAIHCLMRLAARATAAYGLVEAVEALEQALAHARGLPTTPERDRETVRIVQALAQPLMLLGRLAEGRELLLGSRETVQALGDLELSCVHEFWLAAIHDHLGEPRTAVTHASEALRLALACGDIATAGRTRMLLAFSSFWAGEFRKGADLAAKAANDLHRPEEELWRGMAVYAGALNLGLLGEFDATLAAADELRQIGAASGDRRLESYGHHVAGWVASQRGDSATAVAACGRAVEIAPDPLAIGTTLYYLGEARLIAGEVPSARLDLARALDCGRQSRFAPLECLALSGLADAKIRSGEPAAAQQTAREALALAERISFAWGRGRAHRVLGHAARAIGERELAVSHFRQSLDIFTRLSAPAERRATARLLDGLTAELQ